MAESEEQALARTNDELDEILESKQCVCRVRGFAIRCGMRFAVCECASYVHHFGVIGVARSASIGGLYLSYYVFVWIIL